MSRNEISTFFGTTIGQAFYSLVFFFEKKKQKISLERELDYTIAGRGKGWTHKSGVIVGTKASKNWVYF